jgi:hypothetical protein
MPPLRNPHDEYAVAHAVYLYHRWSVVLSRPQRTYMDELKLRALNYRLGRSLAHMDADLRPEYYRRINTPIARPA